MKTVQEVGLRQSPLEAAHEHDNVPGILNIQFVYECGPKGRTEELVNELLPNLEPL